jgi:hypothetical protein
MQKKNIFLKNSHFREVGSFLIIRFFLLFLLFFYKYSCFESLGMFFFKTSHFREAYIGNRKLPVFGLVFSFLN